MAEAISHGLLILSWYESHPEKDVPPENMWDDTQGLEEHWKLVKMRADNGEDAPDEYDEDDDLGGSHSRGPGPQMLGNDLANVFKD